VVGVVSGSLLRHPRHPSRRPHRGGAAGVARGRRSGAQRRRRWRAPSPRRSAGSTGAASPSAGARTRGPAPRFPAHPASGGTPPTTAALVCRSPAARGRHDRPRPVPSSLRAGAEHLLRRRALRAVVERVLALPPAGFALGDGAAPPPLAGTPTSPRSGPPRRAGCRPSGAFRSCSAPLGAGGGPGAARPLARGSTYDSDARPLGPTSCAPTIGEVTRAPSSSRRP
jgi:hypothetical protein